MATDPMYQVDLTRVADQPVTEGVHPFTIVGFDEGEGQKGPYWKFTMRCDSPGEEGKTLLHFVSLTPQARWRLEIFLDAVGAPGNGAATADKFMNRRLRGNVEHQDYEGRAQARLKEMYPISQVAEPTAAVSAEKPVAVRKIAAKKEASQPTLPATGDEQPAPF